MHYCTEDNANSSYFFVWLWWKWINVLEWVGWTLALSYCEPPNATMETLFFFNGSLGHTQISVHTGGRLCPTKEIDLGEETMVVAGLWLRAGSDWCGKLSERLVPRTASITMPHSAKGKGACRVRLICPC